MDWMQQVRDFYWITESEAMQIVTEEPRDQTIFIEFTQHIFCSSLMLPWLSWIGIGVRQTVYIHISKVNMCTKNSQLAISSVIKA